MRLRFYFVLVVFICSVYFYNTIWFQSFFMYDTFYANIANVSFDVTQAGATAEIPIRFKYKTCYDLGVVVPGAKLFDSNTMGEGRIGYKFVSKGKLLAKGVLNPASHHSLTGNDDFSKIVLMVFNLPFADAPDVSLELEVVEPLLFLSEYKGKTSIVINPNYIADFGECYNENLRIEQPE